MPGARMSKLLAGFDIPTIINECVNGKFVILKGVRVLKITTTDPRGIPGDFAYTDTMVDGKGQFLKYAPLTTEPVWYDRQLRSDNMGKEKIPLKIEEVKISVRLPEYAARLFRSNTDDGENVVFKAMGKPYYGIDGNGQRVCVWEGVPAMFFDDEIGEVTGEVYHADEYTDFMDNKLGFGKHADMTWREVPLSYLKKSYRSFTDQASQMAVKEMQRREVEQGQTSEQKSEQKQESSERETVGTTSYSSDAGGDS